MARKFKVEGTREFLYWGVGLLLFGLWHARDGWFPGEGVLKTHPKAPESPYRIIFNDDSYYDYNRLTGILSLTASAVCLIIHRHAK